MPSIGLAHPVTQFRLQEPVLPALAFSRRKWVVMKSGFQCEPSGQLHFHTEVGRGEHTREQVAFYCDGLCLQAACTE